MTRRARVIMVSLAALVAGTILIVYILRPGPNSSSLAATGNAQHEVSTASGDGLMTAENESTAPKSQPTPPPPAAQPAEPAVETPKPVEAAPVPPSTGQAQKVLYDLNTLPGPIKRMLEHIVVAAQGGDINEMLPVLQENELPPMLSTEAVSDPIAYWKKASADGEGRDILAAMLNVFSSGFVKKGDGKSVMYIWPYFAEVDLTKLTPSQQVELFRIVPAAQALEMQKSGKYSFYRAGIGNDGVWHYFMQ